MQRLKPQRASIGRVQPAKRPALDGDMARVMNVLRRLTREAMPCPCNSDLGKLAGVGNASQASYVLRKLSEAGFIRSVIVNAATGARVITIIASGAQTREPRP
jgi:hypothetical protein